MTATLICLQVLSTDRGVVGEGEGRGGEDLNKIARVMMIHEIVDGRDTLVNGSSELFQWLKATRVNHIYSRVTIQSKSLPVEEKHSSGATRRV